jgi:hypothetical protein
MKSENQLVIFEAGDKKIEVIKGKQKGEILRHG